MKTETEEQLMTCRLCLRGFDLSTEDPLRTGICRDCGDKSRAAKAVGMKTLTWSDLTITKGQRSWGEWRDRNGRLRVFVSVKSIAFVNHTFWFAAFNPDNQDEQAAILKTMQAELAGKIALFKPFMEPEL